MSDSTRYFQLTSEILVEYKYNNLESALHTSGNADDHLLDLDDKAKIISNYYNSTRTFLLNDLEEKFVLPINKAESKFKLYSSDRNFIEETSFTGDSDILIDTFKLHFTSRNYLGSYDGLIVTVHLYDKWKNKVGLLSQYIQRTDDPDINPNPVFINQKLYTTYQNFTIPNATALINSETFVNTSISGENRLRNALFPKYDIMENSPVVISLYGVKSTYTNNGYQYYNTEKINAIYIPIEDKSNQFETIIDEAEDGDYFKIYPEIDGGYVSFSDYLYNLSDGHPENYIVFHELTLTEHYVDALNKNHDDVTHREQYIINASEHTDDEDNKYGTNEKELDSIMYYRPIVIHSGKSVSFTIQVKTHIINTLDNTTIVKNASLDYPSKEGDDPKKYGKKMNKIYLGEIPAQVNVYNKKPDIDRDGVKIVNSGSSNVKIENHQHSVIGFIECINVGVSIEQVPKEVLE